MARALGAGSMVLLLIRLIGLLPKVSLVEANRQVYI
jgi:hypothetical protein